MNNIAFTQSLKPVGKSRRSRCMWSFFRRSRRTRPTSAPKRKILLLELLEDRTVMSVYTPAQVAHAYGFDQITFGNVKGDGSGQTIAIAGAHHAPNIVRHMQNL